MSSVKPSFVLCPRCRSKSKKVRAILGIAGMQTRQCKKGHIFQFDKWLAERPLHGMFR